MLRTGFIGSDNLFDKYICYWLRSHSHLRVIIWTDQLEWAAPPKRWRKIASRYRLRAKRYGWVRAVDEILYYAVYYTLLRHRDSRRIRALIEERAHAGPSAPGLNEIEDIPPGVEQLRPVDIRAPEVLEAIRGAHVDALFSMCIHVMLPESLIGAPRLGTYLWHEGITPEYRGVHSPFWALANKDYGRLGYTLMRMGMKVDAGAVLAQGTVKGVDPLVDSPSYIGHKAILDSLEETAQALKKVERGEQVALERVGAEDRIYSYPTASALARIMWERRRRKLLKVRGSPRPHQ